MLLVRSLRSDGNGHVSRFVASPRLLVFAPVLFFVWPAFRVIPVLDRSFRSVSPVICWPRSRLVRLRFDVTVTGVIVFFLTFFFFERLRCDVFGILTRAKLWVVAFLAYTLL